VSCSSGSVVDTSSARDSTEKVEEHESRVDKAQLTQMIFAVNGIIFVGVRGVDSGVVSEDAAASAVGSHLGCGAPCAAWYSVCNAGHLLVGTLQIEVMKEAMGWDGEALLTTELA
jgi:hypothetical protein